jgi:hypothetical protein
VNPLDLHLYAETEEGALAAVALLATGQGGRLYAERFDNGGKCGWVVSLRVVRSFHADDPREEVIGLSLFVEERKLVQEAAVAESVAESGGCQSKGCTAGAKSWVLWPGLSLRMCSVCAARALGVAAAMGFDLPIRAIRGD